VEHFTNESQTRLLRLIKRHLNNRPFILFLSPKDIIQHSEQHHRSSHQHAEIHTDSFNRRSDRPKAEEKDNAAENQREQVDRNAPDPWEVKGAPDELSRFAGIVDAVAGSDAAGDAAVEEETLGDDVGGVEGADAEGDDVVEGG